MTVRLYTSLDAGAPVLAGDIYARVQQILLACLVNGYGSKPAAGWTLGHDVTDGFSLGNGDGFINLVRSSPYAYIAYIMEAITNGSAALAAGVNRRSGIWVDGSSTTQRQAFNGYSSGLSSTNPHWSVVADGKTCVLLFSGGVTAADSNAGATHYFGSYINTSGLGGAAAFCSLGGNEIVGNAPYFGYPNMRCGSMLRNPYTGLIDQGADARYGASAPMHTRNTVNVTATPKLLPSRLQAVRAAVMCYGTVLNGSTASTSSGIAGYLRGLISEPTLCGALLSDVLTLFGLPNTWQSRVTPITLPNGKQWLPLFPRNGDAAFFVSLDPADWE
jgi:hypothetical protein